MQTDLNAIVAPPLDLDLNNIDTSMPLLAAGLYDMQIVKVEQKTTKANSPMLALDLVTTSPAQSQDGTQLGAGVHVFTNLNLAPSGKATWKIVLQNIAAVTQACGIATTYGEFSANAQSLLMGKTARVRISLKGEETKDGKTYRARNEIENWVKAK